MGTCVRTTSGFLRYLAASSGQAAASITGGLKNDAPWDSNELHQPIRMEGWVGCAAMFWGTGDENDTFTFRLWDVWRLATEQNEQSADTWLVMAAGYGTATLGATTASASGDVIPSGARLVDTLTFTRASGSTDPKGAGDVLSSVVGRGAGANVYSPADGSPAVLVYGDAASPYARVIEFVSESGNTANAAVMRIR